MGLVFDQRDGKHKLYEAAEGRVHYQQHETETTLKITARDSGMAITISMRMPVASKHTDDLHRT